MPTTSRSIIILGMHRSGTSALTGSLEQAGLTLGTVGTSSADNLKGNREPRSINVLHDDLLRQNGGSWFEPVAPLKWLPVHAEFRDLFIAQFADTPVWGFKDPRTLLCLSGWLKALPDAELVGIFRHPFLVAQSLQERNDLAVEDGLELWAFYNRILLWFLDNTPGMHLVEFSQDPIGFRAAAADLAAVLGLSVDAIDFFDDSLRQDSIPDMNAVPGAAQTLTLHDRLRERVTSG